MSSVSRNLTDGLQLNPKTAEVLSRFDQRRRILLLIRGSASALVILLLSAVFITLVDYFWIISDPFRWALSFSAYGLAALMLYLLGIRPMGQRDPEQIARQVEASDSVLREDLLSAVELANPLHINGARSFRNRLQDRVGERASVLDVGTLLPVGLISRWLLASTFLLALFAILFLVPGFQFGRRIARAMIPGAAIQRASMTQLEIMLPSPASGFVAQGDAIAIVVEVSGKPTDEVYVQWRNEDGASGRLLMTPRVLSQGVSPGSSQSGTLGTQGRYAVNLAVGSAPVHYRVLGGDGVTLWETLTPLPRPRVVGFTKQYQFPDYSLLSPRVEEAEHGDLEAIVGTNVDLVVDFDEPVSDAMIHFDDDQGSRELVPVDDSNRSFTTTIPLRTPSTYQIDAVSLKSGLNNPYSPIYSIDPLRDAPPVARWAEDTNRMMIVSPLDVIPFHGFASDDLPIDRVIQEFEINGQPATVKVLELPNSDRELELHWEWDLLHRQNSAIESPKLENGDFIRVRFVAIDRNSQRGESALLELLIADEGFDSDRHAHLNELSGLIEEISDWSLQFHELMNELGESGEAGLPEKIDERFDQAQEIAVAADALLKKIETQIADSVSLPEANAIELLGIAVSDLAEQQKRWVAECLDLMAEGPPLWKGSRDLLIKERLGIAKKYANESLRIEQYGENLLGELLTVAMISDAKALRASLKPMLADSEFGAIPVDRFPRYLLVSRGRLQEINQLLKAHSPLLPENSVRHLETWEQWSVQWISRLESAIQNPPNDNAMRTLVKQFDQELKSQINGRMIDGRIASKLLTLLKDIQTQIGSTRSLVTRFEQVGREIGVKGSQAEKEPDSDEAAKYRREEAFSRLDFGLRKDHLLRWLAQRESLQRSRSSVDLSFAADTRLMQRVLENITREGYQPYGDQSAIAVYQEIGKAYQVIESSHAVRNALQELTQLMLAERRLDDTAANKVLHPTWLERFSTGLEIPCRDLRAAGVPAELMSRIEEVRYNQDYNLARDLILQRRWNGEPMLTGEVPLLAMNTSLESAMVDLENHVLEARRVLQKYVLSLPDQARQAAEEAEEAKERTESRQDSEQRTAEQLATQQRDAENAAEQTLESLMDLANTSSLLDESERELALDADLASNEIQEAAKKAEDLIEQATKAENEEERSELLDQTAQALSDLADTLEQTADHFERAEQGEDLSESRQELRNNAADSATDQLDERYDDAEQLANDAQMSAEEQLRELEQELQQNEPMQQELSDISRRATEAAQRTLEKVAEQEREVMQTLERSDTAFQEQKTRAAAELAAITQRAEAVDEALLNATEQAIGWANTPEARPELQETRDALREAIQEAKELGGDKAPLEEMQASAEAMSEAVSEASQALERLNQETRAAQSENIHQDEASRRRTQTQVERFARDSRTQQLRAAAEERQQWAATEQQANRRIQDAQRQKRDAENQMKQAQQQLNRNPDAAPQIQPQIDAAEDRVERAQQAEQAARETKEFASERNQQTQQRENEIKSKPLDSFEQMNPAAELATKMTEKASEELEAIQQSLDQLSQQMDFSDQLDAPQQTLDQIANRQEQLEQRVNEAVEQLERAARHEERLGQQEAAEQLSTAAESIAQDAAVAANEASEAIENASNQTELSPQANEQVSQAADSIGQAAQALAEILEGMNQEPSQSLAQENSSEDQSQQGDSNGETAPGELSAEQQMAQTLDELDRQLASQQSSQASEQQGNPSESQASPEQTASNPSDSQASEGQNSPSENQSSEGTPTAAESSPTLANNLNDQAQQAARQRQEQLNPSSDQPGQSGDPNQQEGDSSTASDQPGNGQMPDGGRLDASEIERLGADWGSLRQRKTDEVNEGRSATVSPIYRQQVEAYFRTIARQAAEKNASEK